MQSVLNEVHTFVNFFIFEATKAVKLTNFCFILLISIMYTKKKQLNVKFMRCLEKVTFVIMSLRYCRVLSVLRTQPTKN